MGAQYKYTPAYPCQVLREYHLCAQEYPLPVTSQCFHSVISCLSPDLAEKAGLKQTEVKILPWETRIEKLAILSPVSANLIT